MVLTRYKQRLIFPRAIPDARRYSLIRETYSSRPSPRSEGSAESERPPAEPEDQLNLTESRLILTNPSIGLIKYLSASVNSLGLTTSDIELYFSYGVTLSVESLILSEPQISIAKSLFTEATTVAVVSEEIRRVRSLLLSEDTISNSDLNPSLTRSTLLNQLTLHLASMDISINSAAMLSLIEDYVNLGQTDLLQTKLLSTGIDTVALTSDGSFQRILYLNPNLLWLETNTLEPYSPDLTQRLDLQIEVLPLDEVTPVISKLLSLYSDNLQLREVNPELSRYSNLSADNLKVGDSTLSPSRSLSNQPTYLNLFGVSNTINKILIPAIGSVLFSSLNISYSSIGGSEQAKATITVEIGPFSSGYRTYYFNGWDTAVTSGELWKCQTAVWTIKQGSTIVKRHFGLDLVHTSKYDGEEVQLVIVDRGGNVYISDPYYTAIGSSYSQSFWVDSIGGSNSNNGLTSSTPRQTASGIFQTIKDTWTPSGEHILYVRNNQTVDAIGSNILWNTFSQYVGGSALHGRLTIKNWETSNPTFILGTGITMFQATNNPYYGFVSDGINFSSTYANGGTDPGNYLIGITANTSAIGYNIALLNSNVSGFQEPINIQGGNSTYLSGNACKWFTLDNITFGDRRFGTMYSDYIKNVGICNTIAPSSFDNTDFRFGVLQNASITSSVIDRRGTTSKLLGIVFNTGYSATQYDKNYRISISELTSIDCQSTISPFQIFGETSGLHVSSISICNSNFFMSSADYTNILEVNARDQVSEINEYRLSHNTFYILPGGYFSVLAMGGPATTSDKKIRSVMIDNNSIYITSAGGFFTDSPVFPFNTGAAGNYASGFLTFINNYIYNGDDRGGFAPTNLLSINSSSVLESDYNIFCKLASDGIYWGAAGLTINTWQTNTGFDLHSSAYTLSAHNMVNMSSFPYNFSAATSTGVQINSGKPNSAYIDVTGFVRNSPPEVGAYEWSTGLSKPSWWT